MASPLVDPAVVIQAAPPGTMIYANVSLNPGGDMTALFIREESRRIASLPRNAMIDARAGLFTEQAVTVVMLLVRLAGEMYETWWNYCQPDGQTPFERMATQATLPLVLYGDAGQERALSMPNRHQEFFAQAITVCLSRPAWGMADFDAARGSLEHRYPTVADLWRALRRA